MIDTHVYSMVSVKFGRRTKLTRWQWLLSLHTEHPQYRTHTHTHCINTLQCCTICVHPTQNQPGEPPALGASVTGDLYKPLGLGVIRDVVRKPQIQTKVSWPWPSYTFTCSTVWCMYSVDVRCFLGVGRREHTTTKLLTRLTGLYSTEVVSRI